MISLGFNKIKINYIKKRDIATLSCLILMFIALTIGVSIGTRAFKQSHIDFICESINVFGENQKIQFQYFVDEKVNILKGISEYIKVHKDDTEKINNFLHKNSQKFGFSHIFTVDKNGEAYYFKDNKYVDHSEEEFYVNIMENDIYVTEPFGTNTGIIITVCVSVYENDEKQGAVCGAVYLLDVIKMFKKSVLPMEGKVFLLNRGGQYIVCDDEGKVNSQMTIFKEPDSDFSLIDQAFREKSDILGEVVLKDKEYVTDITYLKNYDWAIVYCIENKKVYEEVILLDIFRIASVLIITGITFCVVKVIMEWYTGAKKINTDTLTKCNSRIAMQNLLFDLEYNYEKSVTLIYFDLNKFKEVNDVYGHDEGDRVLCLFSDILVRVFKRSATVGRMGGDEFLAVSSTTNRNVLDGLCEIVNEELTKKKEELGLPYDISASFGYAIRERGIEIPLSDVMKRADANMYKYKEAVRNRNNTIRH